MQLHRTAACVCLPMKIFCKNTQYVVKMRHKNLFLSAAAGEYMWSLRNILTSCTKENKLIHIKQQKQNLSRLPRKFTECENKQSYRKTGLIEECIYLIGNQTYWDSHHTPNCITQLITSTFQSLALAPAAWTLSASEWKQSESMFFASVVLYLWYKMSTVLKSVCSACIA